MKGQAATEYLMTTGILIALILPGLYLFFSYTNDSVDDINQRQITQFGFDLINTIERAYIMGPPARLTLEGTLPDGIDSIEFRADKVLGHYEVVLNTTRAGRVYDYAFSTKVPINGSFANLALGEGDRKITVEAFIRDVGTPYEETFVMISPEELSNVCVASTTWTFGGGAGWGNIRNGFCECWLEGSTFSERPVIVFQDGAFGASGCETRDYNADCFVDEEDFNALVAYHSPPGNPGSC